MALDFSPSNPAGGYGWIVGLPPYFLPPYYSPFQAEEAPTGPTGGDCGWLLGLPPYFFPPGFWPCSGGGTIDPTLPISTLGGLIKRCRATASLVALVGQRVYRRVPTGPTPLPYVVATEVGERFVNLCGSADQYTAEGSYQFAIMATGATADEDAERIAMAIRQAFRQTAMDLDPIPLRYGSVAGTWPAMRAWVPGVSPDKGGAVVVRLVQTINTLSNGSHEPE